MGRPTTPMGRLTRVQVTFRAQHRRTTLTRARTAERLVDGPPRLGIATVRCVSRVVTLVLVDDSGGVLGALPPYEVPMPYWPEVSDVVDVARRRFGIQVTVLRLLATEHPA